IKNVGTVRRTTTVIRGSLGCEKSKQPESVAAGGQVLLNALGLMLGLWPATRFMLPACAAFWAASGCTAENDIRPESTEASTNSVAPARAAASAARWASLRTTYSVTRSMASPAMPSRTARPPAIKNRLMPASLRPCPVAGCVCILPSFCLGALGRSVDHECIGGDGNGIAELRARRNQPDDVIETQRPAVGILQRDPCAENRRRSSRHRNAALDLQSVAVGGIGVVRRREGARRPTSTVAVSNERSIHRGLLQVLHDHLTDQHVAHRVAAAAAQLETWTAGCQTCSFARRVVQNLPDVPGSTEVHHTNREHQQQRQHQGKFQKLGPCLVPFQPFSRLRCHPPPPCQGQVPVLGWFSSRICTCVVSVTVPTLSGTKGTCSAYG